MHRTIYKVVFINQNNVYEIYAKSISQGNLLGFVEVAGLLFNTQSSVVVDPAEEKLKTEFTGVEKTHIPLQAIIRIDEVEKEGIAKIKVAKQTNNIAQFPIQHTMQPTEPTPDPGKV